MKRRISNCLLFVKIHCYNKQITVHGKVDIYIYIYIYREREREREREKTCLMLYHHHSKANNHNIPIMKNEIVFNQYVLKVISTWIFHKKTMKYNHNVFYKKAFLWQMMLSFRFLKGLDSAAIAIVEFQLRSFGDMGDQLAFRLRSIRSSSDLFASWTDRHGSLCKGVNRRRSWRSWGSVRDQSVIN